MSPLFRSTPFPRRNRYVPFYGSVAMITLVLLLLLPHFIKNNDQRLLESAYSQLTRLDHYAFTSRVNQTTHPLPTFENIGLSSERSAALIEGTVAQQKEQISLRVSEQDGHLLDGLGSVEVRVEAGQVWMRHQGQAWEALDPGQALDRATQEPGAFLQAARNVRAGGIEERLGEKYRLLEFDVDGVAWAEVMRRALQAEMTRRGELAPGTVLERLAYYEEMTGVGILWVNEAGLPQRLTLHIVYPPLPGENEYRDIQTTTDFSEWQGGNLLAWLVGGAWRLLPDSSAEMATFLAMGSLFTLLALFPVGLVRFRHHRFLYRTTMALMIVLLVVEPLLNASSVYAAGTIRTTRSAAAEATEAEDAQIQAAVEEIKAQFASRFDVNRGAMASAELPFVVPLDDSTPQAPMVQATGVDSDGDGIDDATEIERGLNPNNPDTDGDGVDEGTEYKLALDPAAPDSDGDLLSDGFEVAGIQMGDRQWYLDPLHADTNGDEILDSLECIQAIDVVVNPDGTLTKTAPKGNGSCADTDSDGIPDFADDDNDHDGVADWTDSQPESRAGSLEGGVPNGTFAFGVNTYTDNKPLRVTLEMRPTTPEHLWYSMNVLDWPSGDYEGQIRRVHDTTLGTSGASANGDMQLVPMVEITIPAADAIHLPTQAGKAPVVGDNARLGEWLDMAVLERYQMAVAWSQDNQSLVVYLPATLIRDKHSNAPVKFVAKVLYQPTGAGLFNSTHTARLVWLVQMDIDSCVAPENSTYSESCLPSGANYENGRYWTTAKQQIVHRYYDSFYVTAFTAEEDVSANGQIFYEDPDQIEDAATYMPDQLLAFGTVVESYLRNDPSPDNALNAFKAEKAAMGNRLVAGTVIQDTDSYTLLSRIATQETPALLDSKFEPHRQTVPHPILLYVTWGQSRVTGLQGIAETGELRLDMGTAVLKHATTIRLGAFTHELNPTTVGGKPNPNWSATNPGDVWLNHLQNQSTAAYAQLPAAVQTKVTSEEFQQASLSLFWNLARGISLPTELSNTDGSEGERGQALDVVPELVEVFEGVGENTVIALMEVLDEFEEAEQTLSQAATQAGTLNMTGKSVANVANLKGALRTAGWIKRIGLTSVTLSGAAATLTLVSLVGEQLGLGEGAMAALDATNATLGAVLAVIPVVTEISKVVQSIQAAESTVMEGLQDALVFENTLSSVGLIAAIVVTAVILVTTLVTFIDMLMKGDGMAAKAALAQGAATAILVMLLFALSIWFPIGTAIALLIGLIDGLVAAICKIATWTSDKDSAGQTFEERHAGICAGIVGNVTAAVAGFFYKTVPMVDMAYKERLKFGQTATEIVAVGSRYGMSAGNLLQITQPLTVTVRAPNDFYDERGNILVDGHALAEISHADYRTLISTKDVFNYDLITDTNAAISQALTEPTAALWTPAYTRDLLYKFTQPALQIPMSAGINWHPDLFVREYYRYSIAECTLVVCDDEVDDFTNSITGTQAITIGTHLIYDVFPGTLTDFYTLEQMQVDKVTGNQYRLAWGGLLSFPILVDADGDGLRGDLDPDDKRADSDEDGLPDTFEVQDIRLDPLQADSDSDGLSDYDEIRLETHSDRADSDGDGLSDDDEHGGWELLYTNAGGVIQRTWVTSDPLVYDTDGDGLGDRQERVLVTHPRARNTDVHALSLQTRTDHRDSPYLAPGATIAFTSTVANELSVPRAYGLLEAALLGSQQAIYPIPFVLSPQQRAALQGTIQVPGVPGANGADITLRNRAGANIIDPSANYAAQLQGLAGGGDGLRFYLSFQSGTQVDNTGNATITCEGNACPAITSGATRGATFDGSKWYTVASTTALMTQPRFSIGGWVTPKRAFGEEYNERILVGADELGNDKGNYFQLSLVDLNTTPKVKVKFTATDGAVCEQTLTALQVPYDRRSHVFVIYNGINLYGYLNGQRVAEANLQNCQNKIPSVRRLTIGRGQMEAMLYIHNIHFDDIDEGSSWFGAAEPYLLQTFGATCEGKKIWHNDGVDDGDTDDVNVKLPLPTNGVRIDINEEDDGLCAFGFDPDDYLGLVDIDPFPTGRFDKAFSGPDGHGTLAYNVQNNLFQGQLDELRIYDRDLSPEDLRVLLTGDRLIYQLDEASGSTQFRNAGISAIQLTCANSGSCPTSGLMGYSGQAVRLNGVANELLNVNVGPEFATSLVTSFWFKPQATNNTVPLIPMLRRTLSSDPRFGYTLYATQHTDGTALRLSANPKPAAPAPIGGNGGNPYTLACEDGEALVGIKGTSQWVEPDPLAYFYGAEGYSTISSISPLCVSMTPLMVWNGTPIARGVAGGGGGDAFERLCPTGSSVVGFAGLSEGIVEGITLQCAIADNAGIVASNRATTIQAAGDAGGASSLVCPFNLPATGIVGRAGGLIDQFGLQCADKLQDAILAPTNAWTHVEIRQSNNGLSLYLNGQLVQSVSGASSSGANSRTTLSLGNGVAGLVDELMLQPNDGTQAYRDSALVYLHFDETLGQTTFASSTGQGNLTCTDTTLCPKAGMVGQVRESIQFSNNATSTLDATPALTLPNLSDSPFTVELWTRIPNAPTSPISLVALHESGSSDRASWRLQLAPAEGRTVPQFVSDPSQVCGEGFTVTPGDATLIPNQWHHLAVSYDPTFGRNDLSIYLNGTLIHTERVPSPICRVGDTLRLGQSYSGQLDEFSVYLRPLKPSEILSHYNYQDTWYEAITIERFLVDYNPPTVELSTARYLQPGNTIFGVAVSDPEAGIRSVEYQDSDGSWKPALTETATQGIWTFGLDVQENTTIVVRATDNVGNINTDEIAVIIDNAPPVVTMNSSGTLRELVASGTVSDEGSGVHAISIMIVDSNGQPFSPPRAVPVENGSWTVNQELPPDVTGAFQIWASAGDHLGNQSQVMVGTVEVDNEAPTPTLDDLPSSLPRTGGTLPIIRGSVTDQASSVSVGLLHHLDQDDHSEVIWLEATLDAEHSVATWQLQLPADLPLGVYSISLRALDPLGNQRIVPVVWSGRIGTRGR